jgi:hypothetical protein
MEVRKMHEKPSNYDWLDKVYLLCYSKKYFYASDDNYTLTDIGWNINKNDIMRFLKEGLIIISKTKRGIEKTQKLLDYRKPEILRKNWIHLSHIVRKAIIGSANSIDYREMFLKKIDDDETEFSMAISRILVRLFEVYDLYFDIEYLSEIYYYYCDLEMKHVIEIDLPLEVHSPLVRIVRGKNFYSYIQKKLWPAYILNRYNMSVTVKNTLESKYNIRISDEGEACPMGINPDECRSYWRQYEDVNKYAYRDFILEEGEVTLRIFLSRIYRGVYYKTNKPITISYTWLIDMLKEDGVIELISEGIRMGRRGIGFGNARRGDSIRLQRNEGYIPIYQTKNDIDYGEWDTDIGDYAMWGSMDAQHRDRLVR